MIGTLAASFVAAAVAVLVLDWIYARKARVTSRIRAAAYGALVGFVLALVSALGAWTADKPDPRAECFYAAFQQAPGLMPHLAPGEKVYGRVKACDDLSPADISSLEGTFQRAFDAAVTR